MVNPVLSDVAKRIAERSSQSRQAYLQQTRAAYGKKVERCNLSCSNLAHVMAAMAAPEKTLLRTEESINLAIVSSYNDMVSAHQPLESYPSQIKNEAAKIGAVAQFAGGVPAMCDGITQGQDGMELSLFSRDVIAMATAIALSHQAFDAALYLGICDKIVPGLLTGALTFGHIPALFVPAGPMRSGLSNDEKSKVRQQYAQGLVGRDALLDAEAHAYHSPGTCTFYGTANSNQMLMEIMGLHIPGAAFIPPGTPLRDALTRAAVRRAAQITAQGTDFLPLAEVIDERSFVNAIVGLMATGGSTNHTLHLVAVARAAGLIITWDDFHDLSSVVPLLARVYPNGAADVNHFQAAGGIAFVIRELLAGRLLFDDVMTVMGKGLERYTQEPFLDGETLAWRPLPEISKDETILRPITNPFSSDGGLKLLSGRLGRAVIKVSAVKPEYHSIRAPAVIFDSQDELIEAFHRNELEKDFIAVVRFQGPRANGMPELHRLVPPLAVLQDKGFKVALVTDGRMSGASGKVPAAIHLTPEADARGGIAKIKNGDILVLDAQKGSLEIEIDDATWAARAPATRTTMTHRHGVGRNLFEIFRKNADGAEQGAAPFLLPDWPER